MNSLSPSPGSASLLLLRGGRALALDGPVVMGILNCTPDSFYDGGSYDGVRQAVDAALRMQDDGASIVDVGGESTRPGAAEVPAEEEIRRVVPVIRELRARSSLAISIDTRKAVVAEAALDAGADVVNDVTALADPRMREVVAGRDAAAILMHMQGTPATMQQNPTYDDVVQEVLDSLLRSAAAAEAAGVAREKILLDPGFGFGKTFEHNALLLWHLDALAKTGYPVVVGLSRKSMARDALGLSKEERLEASLALAVLAALKGAVVFRVHDVKATVRAVRMTDAVRSAAMERAR